MIFVNSRFDFRFFRNRILLLLCLLLVSHIHPCRIRRNATVHQRNHPAGAFDDAGVVGGKNEGHAFVAVELCHHVGQVGGGLGIEVGSGLVGKDELHGSFAPHPFVGFADDGGSIFRLLSDERHACMEKQG